MSKNNAPEGARSGWVYDYRSIHTPDGRIVPGSLQIDICLGIGADGREEHRLFRCAEVGKYPIDLGVMIVHVEDGDGTSHDELRSI